MGVRAGYKKTDLGVIPGDWEVKKLGDIASFNNGKAHESFINDMGEYIVVNSKFISTEGKVIKYSTENISPLREGDITLVMSDIPNGKALAKVFTIPSNNTHTLNQRICSISSDMCDTNFLARILNRNKYFLSFDSGTGQTNLKKVDILSCPLLLPKMMAEQSAIAKALSDIDDLIIKLEKLIDKKQLIKQGAMQKLLNPFDKNGELKEGWELISYGESFDFMSTASYARADLEGGTVKYIHYGDIHMLWDSHVDISINELPTVSFEQSKSYTHLQNGDLVMADASEDYEGIGKSIEVSGINNKVVISGLHTFLLRCKDNLFINGFKGYIHQTSYVVKQLRKMATGLKVYGVTKNNLKKINIPRPPEIEQQRIIAILNSMNMDISTLEKKLAKTKQLKQGMMQQLLTGQIRLVNPQGVVNE